MDAAQVGKLAADFMQQLDETEGNFVEDGATNVRLGDVVIVGEIFYDDEDGDAMCSITTASTTWNRIHQSGIIRWGHRLIEGTGTVAGADEE